MKISEFTELCASLERFKNINTRWPAALVYLIARCDGFLELYSLDETETTPHLTDQLVNLLQPLDDNLDDQYLQELLLQEFDGWYYHANDLGAVWNSLYEDFETYYERHPTACLLIGDQPHANIDHLRKNLASLLKQEAV